jgi:hypothetical protein
LGQLQLWELLPRSNSKYYHQLLRCTADGKVRQGPFHHYFCYGRLCISTALPLAEQPDAIFAAHPELLLDRGVVAAMIGDFLATAVTDGAFLVSDSALDANGGQGA